MAKFTIRAAVLAAIGVAAAAGDASAQQLDVNPPLPNVMLLLDNSGSMERMIDGTLPEANAANTCNCTDIAHCDFTRSPVPNRWATVQQALTGQLANGFSCAAMPRTHGSTFAQEYQIAGQAPYDTNYYLPFHRMVANDSSTPCVVSPGLLPGAAAGSGVGVNRNGDGTVSADAYQRSYIAAKTGASVNSALPVSCNFTQLNNGAVDTMTSLMRFGLMTFDQDPSPAIGVTVGSSNLAVTTSQSPFIGEWSYFPNWSVSGSTCPYLGDPAGCTSPATTMGVGARNPAAPPWEGRMVRFPYGSQAQTDVNNEVQDVITASRPYGATPLAGMLTGAQYYFWQDPTGPQAQDLFVQGDCRSEYMIILTDGAPNLDMRPQCQSSDAGVPEGGTSGLCPFLPPDQIVANLYNNGLPSGSNQSVKTYVIGFAVSSVTEGPVVTPCSSLVANGALANQCLQTPWPADFAACCELQKIALAGGTNNAYFADSPGDLQKALGAILGQIASTATTRATPAYSPVVGNASDPTSPIQEVFYASFTPSVGSPWSGDVTRVVTTCQASSATSSSSAASSTSSSSSSSSAAPGLNVSKGDDFGVDLNNNASSRVFIAYAPSVASQASASIRPYVASSVTDGLNTIGATMYVGTAPNVVAQIQPASLGFTTTGYPYTPNNATGTANLAVSASRDMVLDFVFGQQFTGPSNFTFQPRANLLGDIYHAAPTVVGPPGSLLEDPSYQAFRNLCATGNCGTIPSTTCSASSSTRSTTSSQRPTVVYAATNDGLLHAFWADTPCNLTNSELWTMLLPAAMPLLPSLYPSAHVGLLDGTPVVKDVVWERNSTTDSQTPTSSSSFWHTTLVAGFGPSQRGYYAVDVTKTTPVAGSGGTPALGPDLRWQLTTTPGTFQMFGKFSSKPAITTLFMDPGDGLGTREIGVAVLPGGWDGAPAGGACKRSTTPPSGAGYAARGWVRCWGSASGNNSGANGRALSIVRLDTGELLRVFGRAIDFSSGGSTIPAARILDTPLDSPMTGTPMVYPADVGAVATKIFESDADGTVWRFDVSNPSPAQWTASLFLDLYNVTADPPSSSGSSSSSSGSGSAQSTWGDGQPLEVDPVLSLNSAGQLVLNMATGTTDTFDSNGIYYVYSVTEQPTSTGATAFVNWLLGSQSSPSPLRAGERIAGPMVVFNSKLYFATYFAGTPGGLSCTSGDARIWGMDFTVPYGGSAACPSTSNPASCRYNGGAFSADVDPTLTKGYIDVGATFPGKVVPGVALQATPSCGAFSSTTDPYTGGAHQSIGQLQNPPAFQIVGMLSGVTGSNGLPAAKTVQVTSPMSPTLIDSWAAVLE